MGTERITGINLLLASTVDSRDAVVLDEHQLIEHALQLERAEHTYPSDESRKLQPERLMSELELGAKLPRLQSFLSPETWAGRRVVIREFRSALERLMASPREAKLDASWVRDLARTVRQPVEIRADGSLGERLIAEDLRAALAFVLILLFSESRRGNVALGYCQLERCARYFLSVREPGRTKGPLARTYCSPEHRSEHHDGPARIERKRKKTQLKSRSRKSRRAVQKRTSR